MLHDTPQSRFSHELIAGWSGSGSYGSCQSAVPLNFIPLFLRCFMATFAVAVRLRCAEFAIRILVVIVGRICTSALHHLEILLPAADFACELTDRVFQPVQLGIYHATLLALVSLVQENAPPRRSHGTSTSVVQVCGIECRKY